MNIILQNDLENDLFFNEVLSREDITDDIRQEIIQAKVESSLQVVPKIESMSFFIKKSESELDFIKSRVKELEAKIKRKEQCIKWVKNSIELYMQKKGLDVLEGETFDIKLVQNKESVNIVDEKLLPAWAVRKTITTEPNKIAIMDAHKRGESVNGVEIVRTTKLVIK